MPFFNTGQLDSIAGKIRHIEFGMFTTMDSSRILSSRPLTNQQIDGDGNMWFFTSDDTAFIHELLTNPQVSVTFSDIHEGVYVSVSGRAELLRDHRKADELWNPMLKGFFPGGSRDPHLALIKVKIQSAEYWDAHTSKMMQFYELAKAAATGGRPRHLGEHGTYCTPAALPRGQSVRDR